MLVLDEMIIDLKEVPEIAEWLVNDEVKLDELNKFESFTFKADKVDIAVWKKCKNEGKLKRYLDIYGENGSHSKEILLTFEQEDEDAWKKACASGTYDAFESYQKDFGPTGRHYEKAKSKMDEIVKEEELQKEQERRKEADEAEWKNVCRLDTYTDYDNYRKKFNYKGIHDSDAKVKMDAILRVEDELRRSEEALRAEDNFWKGVLNTDTIVAYQSYIDRYPEGRYVDTAKENKKKLEEKKKELEVREKAELKRKMIEDLVLNANAHPFDTMKSVGITPADLRDKIKDSKGVVRNEVLKSWNKPKLQLVLGVTPDSITEKCTEIYFWGDPGSGKTCAMAAILSCVNQLGYFKPRSGPGAKYMSQLAGAFGSTQEAPAVFLPQGTPEEVTQYMPLTLNAKEMHDLAIIELSGEVFKCFKVAMTDGEEYFETDEKDPEKAKLAKTYKQVKRYLESNNPKYHFFVLDSQSDDAGQADSLNWAAAYFDENKLFNGTTLGISLIVTKCDRLSPDKKQWQACANKCAENRAPALVRSLKQILGPKGLKLTDGRIEIIPLSIGEVFFQKLCIFDSEHATRLVKTLLQYAKVGENVVKTKSWKNIINN